MNSTCTNTSHHPINAGKLSYQYKKKSSKSSAATAAASSSSSSSTTTCCCCLNSTVIQWLTYIFNLILATCGLTIFVVAIVYSLPNTKNIRSIVLITHPINLVIWTTIITAFLISFISFISLIKSCLLHCKCNKSQKLQVTVIRSNGNNENGMVHLSETYDHSDHFTMINSSYSTNPYSPSSTSKYNPSKINASSKVVQSAYSICSMIFLTLFLLSLQLSVAIIGIISSTNFSSVPFYNGLSIEKLLLPQNKNETIQLLTLNNNSVFDSIQEQYKCCGFIDYMDYPSDPALPVPDSCCKSRTRNCGLRKHPSNIYFDGCARKIEQSIYDELSLLSCTALALSSIQVFTLIFSSCLYILLLKKPTYI